MKKHILEIWQAEREFTLNGEKMTVQLTVQLFLDRNLSMETGVEDKQTIEKIILSF